MTDIPPAGYFTSAITNAQAKAAQDNMLAVERELLGGSPETTLVIAGGSVTATGGCHSIDTEGAASADDLSNIAQTNTPDGRMLFIRCADATHVVTVKNMAGGAGQISLAGSVDHVLDARSKWILLKRTGTNWEEVSRSGGSGTGITVTGPFEATQQVIWSGFINAPITANQNDWNPAGFTTASTMRLLPDAAGRVVTGLAGGVKGRIVKMMNASTFPMTLAAESSSSAAGNRFALPFDLAVHPNRSVDLTYDDTSLRWRITGAFVNGVAIGSGMDYWGPSPPPAGYAFPFGQNLSRTQYPLAFALMGTTYGAGDGSTTFTLFDKRDRISIGKGDMGGAAANRVTVFSTTTLGGAGGDQLVQNHNHGLSDPSHAHSPYDPTHAHSIADPTHAHTQSGSGNYLVGEGAGSITQTSNAMYHIYPDSGLGTAAAGVGIGIYAAGTGVSSYGAGTGITIAAAGGGGAQNVQPSIACNYIVFLGA